MEVALALAGRVCHARLDWIQRGGRYVVMVMKEQGFI